MEIRSYRRVFDLERRIYRVDRIRLNPGGIPVRGVVYFLVLVLGALIAGRLPLLRIVTSFPPWYIADVALPAAGAAVLTVIRVEGRPFHIAASSIVRYRLEGHHLMHLEPCAPEQRWRPEEIILLPDGSDCRLRNLSYAGPGGVLVAVEHERSTSGPFAGALRGGRIALTLRSRPPMRALRPRAVIALAAGAGVRVRRECARGARGESRD